MTPKLSNPREIEQAVQQNHGVAEVDGDHMRYVVMSSDVYREMMGIGSEDELQDSLRRIQKGLADVDAGRTVPADQFFDQFDKRHGILG